MRKKISLKKRGVSFLSGNVLAATLLTLTGCTGADIVTGLPYITEAGEEVAVTVKDASVAKEVVMRNN